MEGDQEGQDISAGIEGACVDSEEDTWSESIPSIEGFRNGLLEGCAAVEDGTLETSTGRSFTIVGEFVTGLGISGWDVTGLVVTGLGVGLRASLTLGTCDDMKLGIPDGIDVGLNDGSSEGLDVGLRDGLDDGLSVGVGLSVGSDVGFPVVGFPVAVGLTLG